MDEQTAKKFVKADDYLRSYIYSKRKIEWLQDQIETIESSLDSVTNFHDVHVQQSCDPHRREKLLADIADKKKEIRELLKNIELQGLEVLNTITNINNPIISKAFMLYFVQGMTQTQVREQFDQRELPVDWWYIGVNMVMNMLDANNTED